MIKFSILGIKFEIESYENYYKNEKLWDLLVYGEGHHSLSEKEVKEYLLSIGIDGDKSIIEPLKKAIESGILNEANETVKETLTSNRKFVLVEFTVFYEALTTKLYHLFEPLIRPYNGQN